MQFQALFYLPLSDLQSRRYLLRGCEMKANFMRNSQVFDSDSTNIGPIANLNAASDRGAKTAQFTY